MGKESNGAPVQITFDAYDYKRIADIIAKLPADMQRVAFGRAFSRTRQVVKRHYARFASRVLKTPQKLIIKRLTARVKGGEIVLKVRSTNIPLREYAGAAQDELGVYVPQRGRFAHAFIVSPSAARAAGLILRRLKGAGRLSTEQMFGPSPANAIIRKPADYENELAELAHGTISKVLLQQVEYLLSERLK